MNVGLVFLAALVTALATGLGALPLLFSRRIHDRGRRVSRRRSPPGLMLGASAGLFWEGGRIGSARTAAGALFGAGFIVVSSAGARPSARGRIRRRSAAADARGALMIVGVMTVHSFTEGVGVGVAFGGGAGPRCA